MQTYDEISVAATATTSNLSKVNLQLDDWIEAKTKFVALRSEKFRWAEAIKVVNLLGNSLTTLFGINHTLEGRTPSFLGL